MLGRHFTIKVDHHSLKFLLEQRITTPSEQNWLVNLDGMYYDINYNEREENIVVDALFRRDNLVEFCNVSGVHVPLLREVKQSWAHDPSLQKLLHDIHLRFFHKPRYKFR